MQSKAAETANQSTFDFQAAMRDVMRQFQQTQTAFAREFSSHLNQASAPNGKLDGQFGLPQLGVPESAQAMFAQWMQHFSATPPAAGSDAADAAGASNPMQMLSPEKWQEAFNKAAGQWASEWGEVWKRDVMGGEEHPSAKDKRFATDAWQTLPNYRALADAYVATSRVMLSAVDHAALSDDDKKRTRFFMKQYLDAVSPANFFATNPEAIKLAIETNGESLRQGVANLEEDMQKGHVSITDESAFFVGKNVAVSPGQVVFENEIFQLIQYAPSTPQVFMRPLLVVPPCINKFYILDLTPENSFIGYAVAKGHTVFVVSWRNVDATLGHLTWHDYVANAVVKAIDTVRRITNVEKINALGFCVGGTLLACAIAILKRMGHDVVESVTFLTTFIDFSDAGEICAYIDENFIGTREHEVGESVGGGIVRGADLAFAFSTLRANDLIWSYVVGNYLKGGKPAAFDLLYWNADSTNLPGPWYVWYVRNCYMQNALVKPDAVEVCGIPVDTRLIDMPAFVLGTREDHIVPWRSTYASAKSLGSAGDKSVFTLGASGHIAGVVNPASKNRRSYWSNDHRRLPDTPEAWLDSAKESLGSWWPRWSGWLAQFGGKKIAARTGLGSRDFPPIEAAPGRYVQEKAS
jgi:polyhydroxyalkanoate synthase subunit PhaC